MQREIKQKHDLWIVQPYGWHIKKSNPFDGNFSPEQYDDFERNNPPLPLTAWHQPGSEVEIAIQHQYEPQDEDYFEWRNCSEGRYNAIVRDNSEKYSIDITPVRIAYRVIEVISNVGGENPVDEAKPELSVTDLFNAIELGQKEHLYLLNKVNQEANMQTLGGRFDYQTIVESCEAVEKLKAYTHAIQSKKLVKISDVERVVENRIEGYRQELSADILSKLGVACNNSRIMELTQLLSQLRTLNK